MAEDWKHAQKDGDAGSRLIIQSQIVTNFFGEFSWKKKNFCAFSEPMVQNDMDFRRERNVRWAAGAGPQVNDPLPERRKLGQA